MEQHQDVVLQERVRTGTARDPRRPGGERVGGAEAQHREERRHDEHHDQRPADEDVVGALAEPPGDRGREPRQDQRPQQDRSLEGRPHRGDVVQHRRVGRADLLDVGEREVAGDQCPLHHDDREHDAAERDPGVDRALLEQPAVALADAVEHGECTEHRRREHQEQAGASERGVDARREHHDVGASGQPAASASATRSSLTATYSSECLTSTRSPSRVPFSITPCTTTGMHSLKMPPGSPS